MFRLKLGALNICLKKYYHTFIGEGEFGGRNIRAVCTVVVFDELVHVPVEWTQGLLDLG